MVSLPAMPIRGAELINAAEVVAESQKMMVTLKCTSGAGLFTGLTTVAGGMLGGPVGIVVGAVFGGVTSAVYTNGKFKSVVEIIRQDLTQSQKERLIYHLEEAVRDFGITDVIQLATLVMSNEALFLAVGSGLQKFLTNDLHMQLKAS